jgi:L,D-transpeptidase catalytic domain
MRIYTMMGIAAGVAFGAHSTARATVRIDIDLNQQQMHVTSAGGQSYDWPISSGRPGHATPTGRYRPQAMYLMAHSYKYNNAPMPHAIFFRSQYAIHGTDAIWSLGRVASHGCIRISPAHAATLYAMVSREGASIDIYGGGAPASLISGNPHRAGHQLAANMRKHMKALAYDPVRRTKSLKDWAKNPARPQ